ncbi:aldo/keto reductase [Bifidobacterium crudilactis]|jgi:aryl-alcohol dehydrogenase-like predicted oxidoreductase|uniref:Aldo/keto reductase n=1 Tax=Bifidobacterium crudilactis TaxID=327277 RepID=A0A971CYS8_9BIFI|nr:aldo/keto reductase [Bifidobacterium crudilactis]MCI1664596.1 aldo/keto reductase [Bifidobacterium crudilactis]MCI1869256.1 aldo/keto reductase [Bifidobacterium crudilactis]MCI2148130.1 aldo/keto reductase [Bifidobacterium crudilactis]MCI2157188.1 aldo/keto reductase [Bifidobacterium crudilactis]MDN5972467.1 aldo/keto reductase [Bifidobacterium crudilactis]
MATLGNSGIDIYPLVLGGNTFGWTSDEKTSREVLDEFVSAGGNLIDTADVYSAWAPGNSGGESEIVLGRWLTARAKRDDVLIATKVSQHPQYQGLSADNVEAAANESLLRLGTDYIDLYYAHFDDEKTPLEETVAAFDKLVKEGKVRAIGISNYSADRIRQWFDIARANDFTLPVALEPHYNLVTRKNYEENLLPVAQQENLAVFPYFALASGFLTGKYRTEEDLKGKQRSGMVKDYFTPAGLEVVAELDRIAKAREVSIATVSLAWLRHQPQIAAPIASARIPEQLPALLESTKLSLSEEELSKLDEVSAKVA